MATQSLSAQTAKVKTPIKAIRAKCLDCSGDSRHEVKLCPISGCSLYPYRLGKNPNRIVKSMTEFQKAEIRDRLQAGRQKKFSLENKREFSQKTPSQETGQGVRS